MSELPKTSTGKFMAVDHPRLVVPLWLRAWICAKGFRAWRTRRALDKAICMMIRNDIETELAYQLLEVSNQLWDNAFIRHNADVDESPPFTPKNND